MEEDGNSYKTGGGRKKDRVGGRGLGGQEAQHEGQLGSVAWRPPIESPWVPRPHVRRALMVAVQGPA